MDDRENKTPAVDYAALVARARTGDQDAYTALYEATSQELYRTVRSMVRTEDQTLDIQQDAYVYAFTHLDQLGEPAKFRAWLHTIAVNRTRSVLRRQTALLFSELETEEGSGLPELADESPDNSPELALERKETAELIREILDSLTAGQRLLVGLYYYEQIPLHKIAEDLGVSAGTVKTQLFRSRKKIESAVEQLQKKGVKLFGLSPMPFLLALLRKAEPAAEEAEKAVLAGSLSKAGIVAESAAVHLGRSFFQTALGRVTLGLIAALSVAGGILGYSWIKNHLMSPLGDVRPTETVESAEDLSTEPESTEPDDTETLPPDSSEDLVTEPVTTEPTEPESTESESTEPDPTDPVPTPANPKPTDPTDPKPTDPTYPKPTDPKPSEPPKTSSLLGWSDQHSSTPQYSVIEFYDCSPMSYAFLIVYVQGDETPSIYSDNQAVTSITRYQGKEDLGNGKWGHHWEITHNGTGTASIYCTLNGTTTQIARTNNPIHEAKLVDWGWRGMGSVDTISDARLDSKLSLLVRVSGSEAPELITENSSMLTITGIQTDQMGQWYETIYEWIVLPKNTGTAHLYLKYGGQTVKTFTITVNEAPPPAAEDSAEDLHIMP